MPDEGVELQVVRALVQQHVHALEGSLRSVARSGGQAVCRSVSQATKGPAGQPAKSSNPDRRRSLELYAKLQSTSCGGGVQRCQARVQALIICSKTLARLA